MVYFYTIYDISRLSLIVQYSLLWRFVAFNTSEPHWWKGKLHSLYTHVMPELMAEAVFSINTDGRVSFTHVIAELMCLYTSSYYLSLPDGVPT